MHKVFYVKLYSYLINKQIVLGDGGEGDRMGIIKVVNKKRGKYGAGRYER
jgi:hypothetical protein